VADILRRPMRFGVVGCGSIAQTVHLPVISALSNAKLEAVCDVYESVARQVGKKYDVRYFTDWNELMDEMDLDAVSICTPHDMHVPISVEALGRDINVLCEKPLSRSLLQARELVECEKRSKANLMVAYMWRYDPAIEFVENLFANKEIGQPLISDLTCFLSDRYPRGCESVDCRIMSSYFEPVIHPNEEERPSYDSQERVPGDAIIFSTTLGWMSHWGNLLRGLCGEVGEIVSARESEIGGCRGGVVVIEHKGGSISSFTITDGPRDSWNTLLQMQCTQGGLEIEFPKHTRLRSPAFVKVHTKDRSYSPFLSFAYRYAAQYKHFISCLTDRKPFKTGAEDGLKDVEMLHSIANRLSEK